MRGNKERRRKKRTNRQKDKAMKIESIRTIQGPNIFTYRPALIMKLRLEEMTEKESHEAPGFIDRLLALLPGLRAHRCSKGRPGGFVERLYEGTYFGHIVEHVALELSGPVGISVGYGKTVYAGEPGFYNVVVEYKAERGMRFLLEAAVELVDALIKGEDFPLEQTLIEARTIVAQTELGPSAKAIIDAATRRDIPCKRVGEDSLAQLGYGKNRKLIQAAVSSQTSAIACDIASDKALTKTILRQASIPAPHAVTARTEDEAIMAFQEIGPPVAVKPLDGNQGKGVSLNLTTMEEVSHAFHIASQYSSAALVEEMLIGRDYRALVVNGELVAASERRPPRVTGDGQKTVAELIEIENSNPLRGDGHEKPLTRIPVDPILIACLKRKGLTLDSIPKPGEVVYLRESANLSTGGSAIDVTDIVHSDVARVCERAARSVGLDICGIDLILEDISEPLTEGRGGIVEVNAAPGLRMHLYPSEGKPRDVGAKIVEMLYPEGSPARIPIISITGTNGKTTVTRMIAHILSSAGKAVGMTTTDGIYICGQRIADGDTTGPHSAQIVLSDTSVEVAALETARGGIARRGLGYDWSDIGVFTNIRADHIGQDGIASIEDLVNIKSLVAERVREGGTLILNADDEQLGRLMDNHRVNRIKRNVVYFSLSEHHLLINRHLSAGGVAYFLRDGWIVEAKGQRQYRICQALSIPVTMMGAARFQIANAMAAIAAARAQGISREQAAFAMAGLRGDSHNPGRANLYQVADGHVMIDYGHNPDAFEAVAHMASMWEGWRVTAIIGVPGDRGDALIAQAGRAAARGFHRILVKEDEDLRGRKQGEVANLLCQAVTDESPGIECRIVPDEREALRAELQRINYGELIVLFYDKLGPVLETLEEFGAVSVSEVEGLAPLLNAASL
jgi:cyanophycin synthetase